jgi:hypothetical protein
MSIVMKLKKKPQFRDSTAMNREDWMQLLKMTKTLNSCTVTDGGGGDDHDDIIIMIITCLEG